jgi:glucokinase
MAYKIGLDIGGTKCAVILGKETPDGAFAIVERSAFATAEYAGPERAMEKMKAVITEMNDRYGFLSSMQLQGIGISCGGPLDGKKGLILSPPNLPGWDNVPIVSRLRETFSCPVILENDANACAVAEWKYGAGQGCENLIFLTFGTGMGAGLILNGQLYQGACDMAGEVGHMRLQEFGPVGYGKSGSFEGFCSGGGIAKLAVIKATEQMQNGKTPDVVRKAGGIDHLTAKLLAEAAKEGDPFSQNVYRICGTYLGKGLAILIDLLNPERIILGSIFQRSGELLRDSMERVLKEECLPMSLDACKIVPASLGDALGDYAALSLTLL